MSGPDELDGRTVEIISEVLRGPQLTKDEKYLTFLNGQQWFNKPTQPINPEAAPAYYVEMSPEEREVHDLVIEFTNAANFKKARAIPPTLEVLSKYEGWGGLQTPEVKKLYEWPGVRKAIEIMVNSYIVDRQLAVRSKKVGRITTSEPYSLRTAGSREEVLKCRERVRELIQQDVVSDYVSLGNDVDKPSQKKMSDRGLLTMGRTDGDLELLKLKAREAEQIAFALLYIGNTFESLDSKYDNTGRIRQPCCMNDLVNIPIKNAMNPLDGMVATFFKGGEDVKFYGRFGEWGYEMAKKSNIETNSSRPLEIENIHFMTDENRNEDDFWRVSNRGKDIIIPECYPRDLVKSMWEETSLKSDKKTKLIDFILKGEKIPWNDVSDSMCVDYSTKLGKAGVLSDLLTGKILIKWGDRETIYTWIQDTTNALATFGLRNEDSIKRWILYASVGINPDSRKPKLRDKGKKLQILSDFSQKGGNYLPWDKLFFPWDQRGLT